MNAADLKRKIIMANDAFYLKSVIIVFMSSLWSIAQLTSCFLHKHKHRAEERCLVRSGLVHLLDKLCSLAGHRVDGLGVETQTTRHRVSVLAWAGFQVLASRCVKWEVEDGEYCSLHIICVPLFVNVCLSPICSRCKPWPIICLSPL